MKELSFERKLKIHCKINRIRFKDIAEHLNITYQELHNILNGFQSSIPSKGYSSYDEIKEKIRKNLALNF